MRKAISALLVLLTTSFAVPLGRAVENTWDNSVRASSTVQASPAKITLTWPQDTKAVPNSYTVYRKAPGATSWGSGTALPGTATSYVDTNVVPGTAYEYRIVKAAADYPGYGYVQTGINVPLVENRGKVVLIVDNTYASQLSGELTRLQQDLVGDGWTVLRHDVSRTASVASVKNLIKADYSADPANVKSVFLFGRVPVPYSGEMNPDGHGDHRGAWPADAYYGDMDGNWTDSSVNYSQTINGNPAERTRLSNYPGDGKFDQSTLPSAVELQVGRVDLSNMPGLLWTGGPTTLPSELDLLRQYLNKDHKFRHREINPQRRGIVADYFGWRGGEAFSSSAYGAYAAFFGADKTTNLNVLHNDAKNVWVPTLAANDYLTAYGAGAGSYATIAGLGNAAANYTATTPEIYSNNIRAVFTLLFGSWLGDWDSQDNFMRGVLTTKDYGLTAAWSGRPHWFTHPMGLGETVGYTARLVQNNTGIYQNQVDSSARGTHIALMGDPTLRLHPVAPVRSLGGTLTGSSAALSWTAPVESVLGYHVYRAPSANGPFTRLTTSLITGTTFTDSNSSSGAVYMVRAVKLESTPSGSYHNASQGLFWTQGGTTPPPADTTAPSVSFTAPTGGSTVGGSSVAVSANASDNTAIAGVQFKLNGSNLGSEDTSAPYSVTWNSTQASNGSNTLTAVARDTSGNTRTASLTVNVSNTTTPTPTPDPTPEPEPTPGTGADIAWVDDALPSGASGYGSESWTWITSNPTPLSGAKVHQSALVSGLHEHAFQWASDRMNVAVGDTLFAYVYIDPANPPATLMLHWTDGSWEHRAYWGANNINYGTNGTASRYRVGDLPAAGTWVRLEVPARAVGLEGRTVTGMAFSAYNGRVTWDKSGTSSQSAPAPVTDTTAPTVALSAPAANATVSGSLAVSANASDNIGVAGVQFQLNGANLGAEDTTAPYTMIWDTPTVANGTHVLTAIARDAAGNKKTSANVSVTVSNVVADTTVPTVSVTAPTNGSTVSGTAVAVSANASDNVGVAGVQFQLNGANLGAEDTTAPYGATWNTTQTANGTHVLTAIARDAAGNKKTSTNVSVTVNNVIPTPTPEPEPTPTPSPDGVVVWFDDALPAGAGGYGSGGDGWNWITTNPTPFSGTKAHQSNLARGLHEHAFLWASETMAVEAGDILVTYVYIDPANPPASLMLSWNAGNWEHRAYWGGKQIRYGKDGTDSKRSMGALPATGKWVRLEVPASAVGLEGKKVTGMSFSLYDGRATFDQSGKIGKTTAPAPTPTPTPEPAPVEGVDTVWVDETLPTGASGYGSEAWAWTTTNPAPVSGTKAHQSTLASGLHEHAFQWASATMPVAVGDTLFTYVYIDPNNPPTTLMLSWADGSWEHRAYWGANEINYGTNGTPGRYRGGDIPAAGQWVRLEVPAQAVALEGRIVTGMSFSTYNGRVTWDKSGTSSKPASAPVADTTAPTVSLTSPANGSTISGSAVVVSANASDDVGIANVQFKLNGANLGVEDIVAPYSVTWDTTQVANGAHTLTAVARDAAGNAKTAAVINVTVYNAAPAPEPTPAPEPEPTPEPTPEPGPVELDENLAIAMPQVGDNALTILAPTVLELERINTKASATSAVDSWNFVNSSGVFSAPAASKFAVTVDGSPVTVQSVGFKRRVRYAPINERDLRIGNQLYLQLAQPVAEGKTVVVKNPDGTLWPATMSFTAKSDALRHSPAIHVNQEGYVPSFPKKAMIGYYLGNLGELNIPATSGFKLVNAATGATVYQGSLTTRADVGYNYTPKPYQKVLEADFSSYTTPGEYQLVVPGVGASLPFLINDGIAMGFLRTYALGLYHQRCGDSNALPFTRHTHDACHVAAAEIPSPQSNYQFTWTTIAGKSAGTTPQLTSEASQLYPFVNKGTVDVSGGHHDAGDYSKYTINVAHLSHLLLFTADSIAGAGDLDNLGLPESGDGISDILQEAKQETDYLAKLQDADGGFYFIVYPKTREYESNVTPDKGDTQVVWPKNTSATAASVAALAEAASSPRFKAAYPAVAATYLTKAKLGWQFLINGINKYGKDGAYQKVTFYGDNYGHNDELAWAAAALYAATGEAQYSQKLMEWFPNPASPDTMRWSWWRMSESWGNAMRTYAFAARSGRLATSKLNATYLTACETQIKAAGNDALKWSKDNAYGSAFPDQTKGVMGAGWYFSLDQASDMAVAYQIDPRPEYVDALLTNMNYEAGSNPVNVAYLTGVGLKRQRENVNQYAKNDRRVLPPTGIPTGNIQSGFSYLDYYGSSAGNELSSLSFPSDSGSNAPYSFYDRWSDTWNVTTEFITVNQARSLMSVAALATKTNAKSTAWKSGTAKIVVPTTVVELNTPVMIALESTGLNLTNARVVWEGRDQEPDFGPVFYFTPKNAGTQWVEAEITWPDGRRVFATATFTANSSVITWVDDALPAGAWTNGNEGWNWVTGSPAPKSGSKAHQSTLGSGLQEHAFNDTSAPLIVSTGDKLFAWVYLDPANVPTEIMLHWNDGTWDHRAYWGADNISYGTNGTASRYRVGNLPAAGQWVKLEVPASAVNLEGSSVKGMCFSTFGGRATWDVSGKSSQ